MAKLKKSKKTNSVNQHNPHIAGEYTIEDKKGRPTRKALALRRWKC